MFQNDELLPIHCVTEIEKVSVEILTDFLLDISTSCKRKTNSWKNFHKYVNSETFMTWTNELQIGRPLLAMIAMEHFKNCHHIEKEPVVWTSAVTKEEHDVVGYIAGYVVFKLIKKVKCDREKSCLKTLIADETSNNNNNVGEKLIKAVNRGGLSIPTEETFQYFLKIEENFRNVASYKFENFYHQCNDSCLPLFKKSVHNCTDLNDSEKVKIHRSIMKIYFNVRIHAHVKNIQKKCANVKKSKGLRKSLKNC